MALRKRNSYTEDDVNTEVNELEDELIEIATPARVAQVALRSIGYEYLNKMADSVDNNEGITEIYKVLKKTHGVVMALNRLERGVENDGT